MRFLAPSIISRISDLILSIFIDHLSIYWLTFENSSLKERSGKKSLQLDQFEIDQFFDFIDYLWIYWSIGPTGPTNELDLTLVQKNFQPKILPRFTGKKSRKRETSPASQRKIEINSEIEPH